MIDVKQDSDGDNPDMQTSDPEDGKAVVPNPPPIKETKSTASQTKMKREQSFSTQTSPVTGQESETQTELASYRHEEVQTEKEKPSPARRKSSVRDNSIHPPMMTPNI